jgi:PAS domain S-box-containing protein
MQTLKPRIPTPQDENISPQSRSWLHRYDLLLVILAIALFFLWPGLWQNVLSSNRFMSHGECYLWIPQLVWLHLLSDSLIGLSYVMISATLGYMVYRARRHIPFHWVFLAFGLFIIACGATHFMEVWTIWQPQFWLSGYVKLVTAIASVATAVVLPPLVPRVLGLVDAAKLSEQRKTKLESADIELESLRESQRIEESLRESEARYRRLFESARDGILILDAATLKITDVNPFMIELLGYSRAEFLGKEMWEIGLFSDKEASQKAFREVQETGYIRYDNLPLKTIEGKLWEVDLVSNFYEEEGQQVIQCNIRDITDRKLAEESRDRLAAIVESSDDAILSKTFEGIVTTWNASAERMYGYTAAEAIGRHISFLIPPESAGELASILVDLQRGGGIKHLETVRVRKDGTIIHVSISISPIINTEGRLIGASAIDRDITERKRAEAAMRAKIEELTAMTQQFWQASKLATVGELAASIAHELNNPLATVSLRTESLLGELADGDPKRRALKIIEQEVERMGNLVGNLLQFSRRNQPQISTIDVYKEIENTLDFIEHYLSSRQINVMREFADTLPTIHADRQQLRQVFLNLLTNASDAMTQGGTLTVRVAEGQTEHGAGAIVIEFADTGTGIKPDDLLKVWEPFFTTKSEGKGTGLGLAICHRIVEEHKGTINIESEVGQGTTVRITLPTPEREGHGTRSL